MEKIRCRQWLVAFVLCPQPVCETKYAWRLVHRWQKESVLVKQPRTGRKRQECCRNDVVRTRELNLA